MFVILVHPFLCFYLTSEVIRRLVDFFFQTFKFVTPVQSPNYLFKRYSTQPVTGHHSSAYTDKFSFRSFLFKQLVTHQYTLCQICRAESEGRISCIANHNRCHIQFIFLGLQKTNIESNTSLFAFLDFEAAFDRVR